MVPGQRILGRLLAVSSKHMKELLVGYWLVLEWLHCGDQEHLINFSALRAPRGIDTTYGIGYFCMYILLQYFGHILHVALLHVALSMLLLMNVL